MLGPKVQLRGRISSRLKSQVWEEKSKDKDGRVNISWCPNPSNGIIKQPWSPDNAVEVTQIAGDRFAGRILSTVGEGLLNRIQNKVSYTNLDSKGSIQKSGQWHCKWSVGGDFHVPTIKFRNTWMKHFPSCESPEIMPVKPRLRTFWRIWYSFFKANPCLPGGRSNFASKRSLQTVQWWEWTASWVTWQSKVKRQRSWSSVRKEAISSLISRGNFSKAMDKLYLPYRQMTGILIAVRPPGCVRIMKYYKGLDRSYGQVINTLDEVDDELLLRARLSWWWRLM